MHAAADRGEIKKSVVDKYDKKTDFSKLPEKKAALKEALLDMQKEAKCSASKKEKISYIKKMLRK